MTKNTLGIVATLKFYICDGCKRLHRSQYETCPGCTIECEFEKATFEDNSVKFIITTHGKPSRFERE